MVGALFIVGAIILAWMVGLSSHQASMSFFGAGGMLLIGGLFLFRSHLGGQHTGHQNLTRVSQLHRTNLGRRKGRDCDCWFDGRWSLSRCKHRCFSEISRNKFLKVSGQARVAFPSGRICFTHIR